MSKVKEMKRHLDIITTIKETTAEASHLVKISQDVLDEVTDGDPDPRFVIVEFEEGTSENNVTYDKAFFVDLAEQVNKKQPAGYMGHKHFQGLDKEDLLPDPQVVWLGATVNGESGRSILTTKGYLIPNEDGGKARGLIKRKAINSVSWSADAVLSLGKDGSYRVKEFFLESIDFARKNRAGMKNQRLTVVTEMKGEGNKVDDDDLKGAVSKLTLHELKEYNAPLVNAIKEMAKDEVATETAVAVKAKEDELTAAHETALATNPDITMMQRVKELLGITDDSIKPDELLATMIERLDEMGQQLVQSWFNTEILEKKVPNEKARKLVARLIPVKEMKGDFRSERGIEKAKQELENKADELLENDEDIQTVIKEMAANRGGPRFSERNNDRKDNKNDDKDEKYKDTDNLSVEKVRVG